MKIVVALGGNALGNTPQEQLELVRHTAKSIVDLVKEGHEVIIGHGNGPQVGMINLAMEYAGNNNAIASSMPFPECGAMSQGYIGYHLQQAIANELRILNINRSCVTLITQVIVDKNDEAFSKPTKPIGAFYSKEESELISKENAYTFIEDSGRGYRRVVPSPIPIKIVELPIIKEVSKNNIVITVGGGGVPVVDEGNKLEGVAAVIDKDRSCAKLASDLNADVLLILTAVDKVSLNFNSPNQIDLDSMTVNEAEKYLSEGHFKKGSMLPKVEACLAFLKERKDGLAIITSLEKASQAFNNGTGTKIKY
ncbi:MAG: carbamate kinase [Tissierellia bacterium]|nr:carbamate kinase [Tissierellia bacterium]